MGAGWHYRPLHDFLAQVTDFCYAVDHHPEILDLPPMQKGTYVVADFSRPIIEIPAASLDRIFCISVLEELINYEQALSEFKRLLKPDGRIVITMDAPFDPAKPAHEKYKGVNLAEFETAMLNVGWCMTTQPDVLTVWPSADGKVWDPPWAMPKQKQNPKWSVGVQPKNVVSKCTFCYHRISQAPKGTADLDPNDPQTREFTPACVVTCAPTARYFGDLDNPKSKVRQLISEKRGVRLNDHTGNPPQVYYLAGEAASIPETRSVRKEKPTA